MLISFFCWKSFIFSKLIVIFFPGKSASLIALLGKYVQMIIMEFSLQYLYFELNIFLFALVYVTWLLLHWLYTSFSIFFTMLVTCFMVLEWQRKLQFFLELFVRLCQLPLTIAVLSIFARIFRFALFPSIPKITSKIWTKVLTFNLNKPLVYLYTKIVILLLTYNFLPDRWNLVAKLFSTPELF